MHDGHRSFIVLPQRRRPQIKGERPELKFPAISTVLGQEWRGKWWWWWFCDAVSLCRMGD